MSILMCPSFCFQTRPVLGSNFPRPTSRMVKGSSLVKVQIFDQRKFKQQDQGSLGFVEIRVTDYLDLELGGHGTFSSLGVASPLPPFHALSRLADAPLIEVLQLELKGSNDNLVVQGKLTIYLSTNFSTTATGSRPADSSVLTFCA